MALESNILPGVTGSVLSMGVFGAVAGGAIAAVGSSVAVAKGELSGSEAVLEVAKETVGGGLCTAAGMVAMRAIGAGGIVGIIAFFAAAGIAKTVWDSMVAGPKNAPPHVETPD
jgi:hypothetical protein